MAPIIQQNLRDAGQQIASGAAKLLDGNPANNAQGVGQIASGVSRAVSITSDMLDQYLNKQGMKLSDLVLPKPERIASYAIAGGIIKGIAQAMREPSEEEKQAKARKEEAEKKAKEAEEMARKAEDDRRRAEFVEGKRLNGDGLARSSKNQGDRLASKQGEIPEGANELRNYRNAPGGLQGPQQETVRLVKEGLVQADPVTREAAEELLKKKQPDAEEEKRRDKERNIKAYLV